MQLLIETCEFPNNTSPRERAGEEGKLTRPINRIKSYFVNRLGVGVRAVDAPFPCRQIASRQKALANARVDVHVHAHSLI
jgi:hypothetical protein